MVTRELVDEMHRLSTQLDDALEQLGTESQAFAHAENAYRHLVAATYARARVELDRVTVPERDAWVKGETADARLTRDLADVMRQVALETVRSRRAQISAWQTIANVDREEAGLARTGPR